MTEPSNPYRTLESPKRGPLTIGEKAKAALSGLLSFEPLLEIASRGLDSDIPRSERLKYAAKLGKSSSTERIYSHLVDEKDTYVKESLAYAFVEAYHRKMGHFDMALCNKYSAMGAISLIGDKDRYSRQTRGLAAALLANDEYLPSTARSALESVAYGRPQV